MPTASSVRSLILSPTDDLSAENALERFRIGNLLKN